MKILFLDYNDNFQKSLITLLKSSSHDILISQSPDEALASFKKVKPDFLALNWGRPEMRLPQFFRSLSALDKTGYNPIVFLAKENEIRQYSKDIKLDQVYWLPKSMAAEDALKWLKDHKILKEKQAEVVTKKKCLQETCHITTAILNAVPSALVVVDEDMTVTNFNRGFNKLFDLEGSEIPGSHICDLIHKEDIGQSRESHAAKCLFLQAVERLSPIEGSQIGEEVMLLSKSGEPRYFTLITSRLPSTGYRLLVDIRDVTERKKQDEDMALRDRLASLGGLSIGVAHEINNPNGAVRLGIKNISTIFGMLSPLMNDIKKQNPDLRFGSMTIDKVLDRLPQLCDGVLNATDRVAAVVNNLKKFGRKDAGGKKQSFNINNTINNAVQLTNHILNETGTLDIQPAADLPVVEGFETEIEQVLINFISNSCDSIKQKKAQSDEDYAGCVTIKSFLDKQVIIEVSDNGVGIKEAIKEKIFEPYYTSKPYGVGTGLGLSISLKIIKKHNGHITCKSEAGAGASFRIELPPKAEAG